MKTYACVVYITLEDEGFDHPARWQWDELIGEGVETVTVYDVTDGPIERVRLTAEGLEDIV
jgi:hypothetical protein